MLIKKLLIGFIFTSSVVIAQSGGDFAIKKSTIAGGGDNSGGGNFALTGTIGQVDASNSITGGDFALAGGFWLSTSEIITPEIIFENGFEQ